MPPPPLENKPRTDWSLFNTREQFELSEFLFSKVEMSAGDIDCLMEIWAASNRNKNYSSPFINHHTLYKSIDNISLGHIPWESFSTVYTGPKPLGIIPKWMEQKYKVHFRDPRKIIHNMLSNPDFNGEFDYMPFKEFRDGKHQWRDFMSGNWAWRQAVCCYENYI
jgi:Plavaka transposase